MKRKYFNMDDKLAAELKKYAKQRGETASHIIRQAIRELLRSNSL